MALFGALASAALLWVFGRIAQPWVAVGWVALVPWLRALDGAASLRAALRLGVVMSVAFSLLLFGWFPAAIQGYARAPAVVCWLVFVLAAPVLEPQFITFALARHLAQRGDRSRRLVPALAGALVYVGTEWALPKLFADTLGHGLYGSVYLRQAADLAGAPGLTFLLLLGNECVCAAFAAWIPPGVGRLGRPVPRRPLVVPLSIGAALVLGDLGYGYLRLHEVQARRRPGAEIAVGLVQASITNYDKLAAEKGTYDTVRSILDTHYRLSDALLGEGQQKGRPDLLIWPETVYPTTYGSPRSPEGAEFDGEIAGFVRARQVPLIFGAYDLEDGREFNAAVFLAPGAPSPSPEGGGRIEFSTYRKTLLFPLTEYVPEWLDSPRLRAWFPWTGTWKRGPGPRVVPFELRGGRPITLLPLICYEAIFPGYVAAAARQGQGQGQPADMIVTLSNDAWFAGTPAPRLHLLLAAFRSIETRLPQVRVTNSGVSALIDATGEITVATDMDQQVSLTVQVPAGAPLATWMVAWGDWFGPVALVAGLGLLIFFLLRARPRRPS
jgi:apolipoprotein N-acyltransferase